MSSSNTPLAACKPDFDECLARIYSWYEQKIIDRPPVRFYHHNVEYEHHRSVEGPWESEEQRWLDVDFQLRTFVDSLEGTKFLGETFPVFCPDISSVVYNLFLGQRALFDDVTVWTYPCIEDIETLPELPVQWDNKYFRTIEQLTHRALECAEGRFLVAYTDMYVGVDVAVLLRGTEQVCLDLLTSPDQVKKLIDLAFSEYGDVYSHFDRILKAHGQLSVTWMALPCEGTANVLASDFATNISSEHFDEFCMPIMHRGGRLFTHNVFHMDGPGVAKNIESILTLPNMVAVQWAQGYGKDKPIMQWVPLIQRIQQAGKSVIVDLELDELDEFTKEVDPAGILLWVPTEPKDQVDVLARVAKW